MEGYNLSRPYIPKSIETNSNMLGFKFDWIQIIESLRKDDSKIFSGQSLYNDLNLRLIDHPKYKVEHISISSKVQLTKFLNDLAGRIQKEQEVPILHFSFHGYQEGIEISPSNEKVTWRELKELITPINIATQLNLMINFSSCYGQNIFKIYDPIERAAFLLSIGPKKKIMPNKLYDYYLNFYWTLIETKDIIQSIESKGKLKNEFLSIFDYSYFLAYLDEAKKTCDKNRLKGRMTQQTNKLIKKGFKVEDKAKFISTKSIEFKGRMMLNLANIFYHHFMVDLYPENAIRFRVDEHRLKSNTRDNTL